MMEENKGHAREVCVRGDDGGALTLALELTLIGHEKQRTTSRTCRTEAATVPALRRVRSQQPQPSTSQTPFHKPTLHAALDRPR